MIVALEAIYVLILLLAAVSDARRYLIPNILPLLLLLLAGIAVVAGFPFYAPLWSHALHFIVALGVGMLLFHLGWFGGGDVKLYSAVAAWFSFPDGAVLLLLTSISGVGVVILSVLLRLALTAFGSGERDKSRFMKRRIPYGVAIAVGGIATLIWVYR